MKSQLLKTGTEHNSHGIGRLRAEILRRRYLRKEQNGRITETPEQMFLRVATTIAEVEDRCGASDSQIRAVADEFYELMVSAVFLPNSPTLMNAGRENGMLSACFVLPIEDSIEGIFETIKQTALIQKAGGGTGFSFDKLRPTGDRVASSGGTTSGPISFWRVLSETTTAIQQGAFRRGANMGMMSIQHPDILKFIQAKRNLSVFTNFNISVKVSNAFMKRLADDPDASHIVVNPRTQRRYVIPHSVDIDSYTIDDLILADREKADCYTVREIWDRIVFNAHATGEPGICFIDKINEDNPMPNLGRIEATNPCGEQPLLPYEACTLGSINLGKSVTFTSGNANVDWSRLAETVRLAVRLLDNTIDISHYPISDTVQLARANRKIGLGAMGFADILILLGIKYDSEKAVDFAEKLARFVQKHAHDASEELAKERGTFPNWEGSIWDTKYHRRMRNAACTTIAPTGSISIIAGCSSGIEPIFSINSKRKVLDGQKFMLLHPLVEDLGIKEGWLSARIRKLLGQGIPPRDIPEIPRKLAGVLLTAHEVSPEWHVRIQAAFQKHTDNAVSKTVNLPLGATVEDVHRIFRLAYELGCKGITVYRDTAREGQVIRATGSSGGIRAGKLGPRPRPRKTAGETIKFRTGCGTLFVTVNKDEYGICEAFASLGKSGGCAAQTEATCRAISIGLRSGINPEELIEQLRNIRCLSTVSRRKSNKDITVVSCADAIAAAIEESLHHNCKSIGIVHINRCPDCGHPLRREEGCNVCDNCRYTKCG